MEYDDKKMIAAVLAEVYSAFMKLLGPYMPFVTHEIAGELEDILGIPAPLAKASWPKPSALPDEAVKNAGQWWDLFSSIVAEIRALRSDLDVPAGDRLDFRLRRAGAEEVLPMKDRRLIEGLAKGRYLAQAGDGHEIKRPLIAGALELFVYIKRGADSQKEIKKLEAENRQLGGLIQRLEQMLNRGDFIAKAPPEVVGKERERLKGYVQRKEKIADYIRQLKNST
ncbi:MAG: class I tRNA ligase family protein [Elusimicrobia bacterium]|nr:class I tRNA ligase family protein [Elusimicrobiota bacterium]